MNRPPIRLLAAAALFCVPGFSAQAAADIQPSLYSTPYSFVELLHVSAEAAPAFTGEPAVLPGMTAGSPRLAGEAPRMFSQSASRSAQWSRDPGTAQVSAYAAGQGAGSLARPAGWLAALSVLAVLAFIFVRRAQPLE